MRIVRRKYLPAIALLIVFSVQSCAENEPYDFAVSNQTPTPVPSFIVAFTGHGGTWDTGFCAVRCDKIVADNLGPVPDSADVTWTDGHGTVHRQHVKITPLPRPTSTSYNGRDRMICFVIHSDGTVSMIYHDPLFEQ